jgi:hypothetical protein
MVERAQYVPTGPYTIKTGPRSGKILEVMLLRNGDYKYFDLLNKLHLQEPYKVTSLTVHLDWLAPRCDNRPTPPCSCCGQRQSELFAIRWLSGNDFVVSPQDICCLQQDCKARVRERSGGQLYPIGFSILGSYESSTRKRLLRFFWEIHGVDPKMVNDPMYCFQFFAR